MIRLLDLSLLLIGLLWVWVVNGEEGDWLLAANSCRGLISYHNENWPFHDLEPSFPVIQEMCNGMNLSYL